MNILNATWFTGYELLVLVSFVILIMTVLVFLAAFRNIVSRDTTKRQRLLSVIVLIFLLVIFTFIAYSFYEINTGLLP
jgi:hypothetical protein